nr:DNA polymerase III subunit delta [uncultured Ligilactobacillus sp.]
MNIDEALKQIKDKNFSDVYLVIGEEKYEEKLLKKAFKNVIPHDEQEFNSAEYDMETTSLSVALNDAMSVPFFGDKRLVLINNPYFLTGEKIKSKVEHNINEFSDYLKNPLDTTILVIFAPYKKLDERKKVVKLLKKTATVINNQLLDEQQVRQKVINRLKKEDITIDSSALDLLLERTMAKMDLVMNEVDKLCLFATDKHRITLVDVDELVTKSLEQNVFDLVDLVMEHNVAQALAMYRDLLAQKEEPLKINAILLSQFRLLLQVKILKKHGYAQGNIASTIKVHPYRVKLALRKINRFSIKELKRGFLGLVENELKMKSTQESPELLFQMFLLQMNTKKNLG